MGAIETSVEVSECEVTPTRYATDTSSPWVSIDFEPRFVGRGTAVRLSIATTDELDRIISACEEARSHFEREAVTA